MEMTARELIELACYVGSGLMRCLMTALIGLGSIAGVGLIFAVDQIAREHKKSTKNSKE